ncbi:MAG: histidine--tRNA ligase [Polyangiaceae bacterium]|nr:histidine--tRNA ligase [Polyangiaceae bacterium]
MNDILPEEARKWHRVESVFRRVAELYGYGEVRTPVIEDTALFVRQIGETSDVVEKEMYSFERHGDALTVRPEGTAGAARAFVEHGVASKAPISRWYYLGPMFRGERPAKGRYRQFYQAGCELFGDPGPVCDAEMIELCLRVLRELGIRDLTVHINSLGSGDTRVRYRDALLTHLKPKLAELSEDSQRRLEKNPLRILDSKDPRDRAASETAPSIVDVLDEADRAHFDGVCAALDALGIEYVIDPKLVRGLDYYTRTLFEIKADAADLGAQSTVCGGGRYDEMVESLGGPKTPAIGFAMGLERILVAMGEQPPPEQPASVYLAAFGKGSVPAMLRIASKLRDGGVNCEVDAREAKLKAMLKRAGSSGAAFCVIAGDDELARGVVTVKDLAAHAQEEVRLDDVVEHLVSKAKASPPALSNLPGEVGR